MLSLLSSSADTLPDGFYPVVRTVGIQQDVGPLESYETVARYNPVFETQPPKLIVVVERDSFVPIQLREAPTKTPDKSKRTQFWLQVRLTDEAAEQFEAFTRERLGSQVAIVVGGEVVTLHKIRSVIEGGRIQISRCDDKGCEILFRKLQDNIESTDS